MTLETERRSLIRHGFLFIVIAFFLGLGIVALPNPGRWLAAHLTALLTGPLLIVSGLAWRELRLTDGQRRLGYRCALISAYGGLVGNLYGAISNLPGPASNPGVAATATQNAIFLPILAIVVTTLFIAFGLALYGMRGEVAS